MNTPYYAPIGPIATDTLKPQRLIPAFIDALTDLIDERSLHSGAMDFKGDYATKTNLMATIEQRLYHDSFYFYTNQPDDDVKALEKALNEFASPNSYFGPHLDDDTHYGFWPRP